MVESGSTSGDHRRIFSHKRVRANGARSGLVLLARQEFCREALIENGYWREKMTRQAEVSVIDLKRCPRCEQSLPISQFGVCRAGKDGLNVYCKPSILK